VFLLKSFGGFRGGRARENAAIAGDMGTSTRFFPRISLVESAICLYKGRRRSMEEGRLGTAAEEAFVCFQSLLRPAQAQ